MRLSQFHLRTVKETPAEAELVSHKLMLRTGMIRKLASGLYTWTPLGLRVLRKVENVVRSEMNAAGAIEMLMPTIQPRELWEETGRWEKFGPQLLKITDRKDADYCYAPTAEERKALKKALVTVHEKMASRIGKETIQEVYKATGFDPAKL